MPAALAVVLSLLLGSPVVGTLALPQIAALAGMLLKDAPGAIKTEQQLIALLQSPAFREWAAANSERAILLQPGIKGE